MSKEEKDIQVSSKAEVRNFAEDMLSEVEKEYSFVSGLALGVILGILGNFLASHWIEVLRGIVPEESWWEINLVAFFVFLSTIAAFVMWVFYRLKGILQCRGISKYIKEHPEIVVEFEREEFSKLKNKANRQQTSEKRV